MLGVGQGWGRGQSQLLHRGAVLGYSFRGLGPSYPGVAPGLSKGAKTPTDDKSQSQGRWDDHSWEHCGNVRAPVQLQV